MVCLGLWMPPVHVRDVPCYWRAISASGSLSEPGQAFAGAIPMILRLSEPSPSPSPPRLQDARLDVYLFMSRASPKKQAYAITDSALS